MLIDLIENGPEPVEGINRFPLCDELIARYRDYIAVVGREGDHDKIHYPFWHLCGDDIKKVYDYRCAASGVRFRLGDLTIVDACHLIPFAESGNDHPTNGIALSKNHHWALDRHLIAPFATETKLVWRTAPCLDDRLEGHKDLLKLEGRSVLLPREKRFWPADEGLQWRTERLRGVEALD